MFSKIATTALLSGAICGILIAILQLWLAQPLLMEAELYESGQITHFGEEIGVSDRPALPAPEITRTVLFFAFSTFLYCGLALILVSGFAVAAQRGCGMSIQTGLLWGISGFVIMQLAPALSLAPELPGFGKTDISARQIWYFTTVASAAVSVLALVYARKPWHVALAVGLFFIPHLRGAPEPEQFMAPMPPEIAALFAVRSLGIGFIAWCLLGALCSHFWMISDHDTA